MIKILIDQRKGFYKANLHCHSTNSDGCFSPQELKEQYLAKGYSVVAFSDHEHLIDHSYLNDEQFVAITACEVAIKEFPEQSTLSHQKMRVCQVFMPTLQRPSLFVISLSVTFGDSSPKGSLQTSSLSLGRGGKCACDI